MPVVRLEIKTRQPLADGRIFDHVGCYEQLDGTAHFAVDPAHRLNCAITDIDLAERRRDGFDPFGASVVVMAVHSPLMIAHQWACLDHASNGRAILGVGLGREHHYRQFEVPEEGRVTRFREELAGKITITGK